ncbi:hypothetical protein JJB98_05785 [Bradyrhizobium diazoefficiens]|nr:hypothetical protein [Bradyrhizobium diazoefficiens]QQO19446.1 hypothetical protein JJB98_05785 [Bradyrhizobium diazoefficiens]
MGDFLDILNEASTFETLTKLEHFLHREPPPSMSDQTLSFFAYSYEVTFREMAVALKARWRHNGSLQAPLFYVARHSIELHLKWAIEEFVSYTGDPGKDCGHNLLDLSNELKRQQFDLAALRRVRRAGEGARPHHKLLRRLDGRSSRISQLLPRSTWRG